MTSPKEAPDYIDEVLTKLENAVSHDILLRQSRSKSGRSPKSIHADAKAAISQHIAEQVEMAENNIVVLLQKPCSRCGGGLSPVRSVTGAMTTLCNKCDYSRVQLRREANDSV